MSQRHPAQGHPSEADGRPRAAAGRLTLGWRDTGRPANLREHQDRYGPLTATGRVARRSQRGLVDEVTAAGLTGRGGGGFPTGTKMAAVASRHGPAVVVANGMESEPASEKDQALLARAPHLVLDGAVLAAYAVGADIVHVCLDQTRDEQVGEVLRAIDERMQAALDSVRVVAHELPRRYVASEETSLVRWLNGGEAKPMATPPRPFERGVQRRPTLIDNVETLAHVALIARFGPAWFRESGGPDAPGTMLVTVTGEVSCPGVHEIELGTPVGDVLTMAGAADDSRAVLIGGYFGTWHDIQSVASLPLSHAGLRPLGASPGAGVLSLLPAGSCGIVETARILGYLASQSARQCGPCTFGLPAIADDFAQLATGRPEGDPLERLARRFAVITGRGACHHPDGAVRMAASALAAFCADARAHAAGRPCPGARRRPHPAAAWPIPATRGDGART